MATQRTPLKSRGPTPAEPDDLIDFFLRWREFRDIAATLEGKRSLTARERQVARWMVAVMDRISARDLQ